ncbi:iron complex outermembrane receptor protein [Acinetobacter calcoaceticus]|uniref:Iron complex outermembrane receptor protein n=1 Tax=Acinetobacter calcoaceticus TaxID=471 RepID=A0A4R1Y3Z7_ACICA|nr:iron complex outermembrane receptor protein [Acinetobacter calcoaceticus]
MQQKKSINAITKAIRQGLGLSLSLMSALIYAEESEPKLEQAPPEAAVQKITITGSSIKGIAAQSASPITIVKTQDLAKQGVTTVEEALSGIAANQSTFVAANNVGTSGTPGSTADLRSLGTNKTLVLLNGRRLANTPYDTSTVDLSTLPLALIDRIEVLKDGASAVYGTDAIGGVINFITKKEYSGAGATVESSIPKGAGGKTQQYSFFAGYGDLDQQGYNIFAALNYRHQDTVLANQREVSRRGGVLPELDLNLTSGGSFPANIAGIGNPYAELGCGDNPDNKNELGYCRYNTQTKIGIVPETTSTSMLLKGTYKINDDLNAIFEYVHAEDKMTTIIAEDVMLGGGSDYFIDGSSPYYPGNGITPGMDGVDGQAVSLNLRSQAGQRVSERLAKSDRVLTGLEGQLGRWDLNTAIQYAHSVGEDSFISGYVNNQQVRDDLANGTLNPFAPSDDPDYWNRLQISGQSQQADLKSLNFDLTLSRPIYTLPAGDVGFAIGTNYRKDDWRSSQNAQINQLVEGAGVDPTSEDDKGSRDLKAIYTEFQIPILKDLSAQIATRYDHYSDFGGSFNPKLALRWQPSKALMFRGSFSTGFRAPSLNELNANTMRTNTKGNWNDPILCAGGEATAAGSQVRDCNAQFDTQFGGNKELQPEKSSSFNLGVVYEPIKNLVLSADYFNIKVENQINFIAESAIFKNPEKYADRFIRNPDQSLAYIDQQYMNLGETQTSGIDFAVQWRSPMTEYGRLGLSLDGTYVDRYKFQTEKNAAWHNAVGRYDEELGSVVPRWKHNANLNWNFEDWHLNLQQTFFKGYLDQNASDQNHLVKDYALYNLSGTYAGFKNLELTLGIKNLFDKDPPASNVISNAQYGYDPRYSDPMGRVFFGRANYKF